ncbi:hypothetical protein [Streptomyces sp. V3I7]|uniref:hypothetical protein n=1 Tax=Streptomyces sp. V3I7 TaxID=3042278 RepID=UPI002786783C|nr:hypothetical protein [Streptomyces sp. V3I7]MDQ0989035.1 hypothetical protein [Streptomyces sp. V3I7]
MTFVAPVPVEQQQVQGHGGPGEAEVFQAGSPDRGPTWVGLKPGLVSAPLYFRVAAGS